jgi:hypothetical protein
MIGPVVIAPGGSPVALGGVILRLAELEFDLGLKAIGKLPQVAAARAAAKEVDVLTERLNAMHPASKNAAIERLRRRVADGDVNLDDLGRAALEVDAATDVHGTAKRVLNAAVSVVSERAYVELRSYGDKWTTDILRPAIAAVVRELETRATLIPAETGYRNDAPPNTTVARDSWFAAVEATERLSALWQAAGYLMSDGIIVLTGHKQLWFADLAWHHPELIPTGRQAATDTRQVLDAIAAGAGPTLRLQSELPPPPPDPNAAAELADVAGVL